MTALPGLESGVRGARRAETVNANWAFRGGLVFLLACALLRILCMWHGLSLYDEGVVLVGAMRVAHGEVPHRDFYANYGPGQFYVLAALFKLFGPSVLVERAWDTLVRAATAAIAYLVVRRSGSRWEAIVAGMLVTIWLASQGFEGFPIYPVLLCAFVGVACLMPFFEGRSPRVWLFAAGLAAGTAVLFRYDAGFYVALAESLVVVTHGLFLARPPQSRVRHIASTLAWLVLGVALVCVPVAVIYVVSGAIGGFRFDILTYPSQVYWRMRSLSFPRPATLWANPVDLAIYLPISVWLTGAATVLLARRPLPQPRTWLVSLLVVLSALFYIKGIVRVTLNHMTLSIVPALVAAVLLYPLIFRSRHRRSLLVANLAVGALFIIVPFASALRLAAMDIKSNYDWARATRTWAPVQANVTQQFAPCHTQPYLGRIACFALPNDRAAAVQYVASRTQPGDRIFVGAGRHDITWANDSLFYFMTGRLPATKWSHYDPGLQSSAAIQREMIDELRRAKPRFVVIALGFETPPDEPNESGRSSGVTLLDEFIHDNYAMAEQFGSDRWSTSVWKAKR